MLNEFHIESMKRELAKTEQENRELKAHCKRLTNHLRVHLKIPGKFQWWIDEAERIIEQSPKTSLVENDAQVIRNLIYTPNPPVNFSLARIEIIERLRVYADDLESIK